MVNITQQKRNRMLAFLEDLKKEHSDDALIKAFNEIENHLKEKKYGLVWEEHEEEVDIKLRENIPILIEDQERKLVKDKNFPYNFLIEGDTYKLYIFCRKHIRIKLIVFTLIHLIIQGQKIGNIITTMLTRMICIGIVNGFHLWM